ncbi:MAG TPA: hypothetical protein VG759_28970 [Candidatus Angelobacter sp.]|jgi:hypothetical protein|nr:hypothetical protein [Candidatus Angelobacter sp.]
MRGIPNNPVVCTVCGELKGSPKDQRCHACRIQTRPNPNKRFHWTPELDQELQLAYRDAHSRNELTENLNRFQKRTGFTRIVVLARATQLGMSAKRRRWSRQEIEVLNQAAGTLSKAAIARKLKRSYWSVKAECTRLQLSARLSDGYSRRDVECLLGVGHRSIRKWITMGWLRVQQGRVTEASIIKFLREHPEEYRLSRVDEAWFKGLLFPAFGLKRNEDLSRTASKPVAPAAEVWLSG